ncbi:hypothetical protein CC86DRAFT_459292 [Ophiobolus disseminans]|uniref:SWI5-dependent HO expression protein 3 n=1 Tax=Ophiobolus disseminans TaxID=1469910 RepID=A0A6A6ZJ53_9PLEO|nr:hypothetical protein CC86DRAFT_459292 [Ophiobolus disseminans]
MSRHSAGNYQNISSTMDWRLGQSNPVSVNNDNRQFHYHDHHDHQPVRETNTAAWEAEKEQLNDQISTLKSSLDTCKAQMRSKDGIIAEEGQRSKQWQDHYKGRISQLEAEAKTRHSTADNQIATMKSSLDMYKTQEEAKNGQIAELRNKVNSLKQWHDHYKGYAGQLESQANEKEGTVNTMRIQAESVNILLINCQNKCNELQAKLVQASKDTNASRNNHRAVCDTLRAELDESKATATRLTAEVVGWRDSNKTLQEEVENITATANSWKEISDGQELKWKEQKVTIDAKKAHITRLRQERDNLKSSLTNMTDTANGWKNHSDRLEVKEKEQQSAIEEKNAYIARLRKERNNAVEKQKNA